MFIRYRILLVVFVACYCSNPVFAQKNAKARIILQQSLLRETVLLNNEKNSIPLKDLRKLQLAFIPGDTALSKHLLKHLRHYGAVDMVGGFKQTGKEHNFYIIQVDPSLSYDVEFIRNLKAFAEVNRVVIAGFGTLRQLSVLNGINAPIVWSKSTMGQAAEVSAEVIFGGLAVNSTLPSTISQDFQEGDGYRTNVIRLSYSVPEAVGIDGEKLTRKIDGIAAEMIREKAAPGAVVLVVKDNKVIFNKAYGTHTYEGKIPTKTTDIFDMASVSKIAATTLAVMHLDEIGKIDLNQTMGHYLKAARKTNKKDVVLRDVMLHQAGFIPYIPFYRELSPADFSSDSSEAYPTKVAENYYLRKGYFEDVMWPQMLESPIKPAGEYVYSDISMYVMQRVIERVTKEPLDQYVEEQFFEPLGMDHTGYNPWRHYRPEQIVPTEDDDYFRMSRLIGYVHDQGAGMAGGVAGHAGLFSTAEDLAKYAQMLLNRGTYGGVQYFQPETVDLYTSKQGANSRRGLGFDRKDPDESKQYPSKHASSSTFGHTGYTGTCIWMDPENQLVYIFLSNRVQPKVSTRIYELDIRSRIQDAVYEALPE